MTLSITKNNATFSITTLSLITSNITLSDIYGVCHVFDNLILSLIILYVVMLSVIMPYVIVLSVIMLSAIVLNVIMLNIMAPFNFCYC
jgi:hypothetical protein